MFTSIIVMMSKNKMISSLQLETEGADAIEDADADAIEDAPFVMLDIVGVACVLHITL